MKHWYLQSVVGRPCDRCGSTENVSEVHGLDGELVTTLCEDHLAEEGWE